MSASSTRGCSPFFSEWLDDPRFDGLSNRRAHEDALDEPISRATGGFDGADLMGRLQAAGVPFVVTGMTNLFGTAEAEAARLRAELEALRQRQD